MKRRARVLAAALLAVSAIALLVVSIAPDYLQDPWDRGYRKLAKELGHKDIDALMEWVMSQRYEARGTRGIATSLLVSLLAHENEEIAEAAAELLRNNPLVVEDADFPALVAAQERGLDVLDVIARIDSKRAIEYVLPQLADKASLQIEYLLIRSPGLLPALIEELRNPEPSSERVYAALTKSIQNLAESESAQRLPIDLLIEIAGDVTYNTQSRSRAIRLLGFSGEQARSATSQMSAWASEALLADEVHVALLRIKEPESVARLVADLTGFTDVDDPYRIQSLLRDLAEGRSEARIAGEPVLGLLEHSDWDVRVHAARTLGFIDYAESVPTLISLLRSDSDWMLVAVAAGSLGRLRAIEAVPELERVVAEHWYPLVRAAALKALRAIHTGGSYPSFPNFGAEFFVSSGLPDIVVRQVPSAELAEPPRPRVRPSPGELGRMKLWWLARRLRIVEYTDPEGIQLHAKWQHPLSCGIKVANGVLFGVDQGEFGGGLYYTSDEGTAHLLVFPAYNVLALHRTAFGIVAVAGETTTNSGVLYLIDDSESGQPTAKLWKRLPWIPEFSGLLPNGDLLLGGAIVRTDGSLTLLPEAERHLEKMYLGDDQ